jgi:hypothetical protein
MTSRPTLRAGGVPGRRVSSATSCTGSCVVGSASRRSWSASLTTRRLVMPPPHESHHLLAAVITGRLLLTVGRQVPMRTVGLADVGLPRLTSVGDS